MKKFLLIIAMWIAFFFYACNGENPQGYGKEDFCNCGIVRQDSIHSTSQSYMLIVENECSAKLKTFIVDQIVYNKFYVGDRICINDQAPW